MFHSFVSAEPKRTAADSSGAAADSGAAKPTKPTKLRRLPKPLNPDEQRRLCAFDGCGGLDLETLEEFLKRTEGFDINMIFDIDSGRSSGVRKGMTPLCVAIVAGENCNNDSLIWKLLEQDDIDVNKACGEGPWFGKTPLAIAIEIGIDTVVKRLLARPDIEVNKVSKTAWCALKSALSDTYYRQFVPMLMSRADIEVTFDIFFHGFMVENFLISYLLPYIEKKEHMDWLEHITVKARVLADQYGEDIPKFETKLADRFDRVMWPAICNADTPRIFDEMWRIRQFDLARAQQLAEDAVRYGSEDVFRKLLDRGIDVNYITNTRPSLLCQACKGAHLNIVRELLKPKHNCNVNWVHGINKTALLFAVDNLSHKEISKKPDAVKVILALLERDGLRLNDDVMTSFREWTPTAFMSVCKYGNIQVARAFLEKLNKHEANHPIYEDSRENEETALSYAYKELCKYKAGEAEYQQYTELFEYLVRHPEIEGNVIASVRIKPNKRDERTCHIIEHVIIRGETHLCRAMLPRLHINEKVDGWYLLDLACRYKKSDILQLILARPRVNLTLGNPFHEALARGYDIRIRGSSWKIIEILLEQPFMADQVNKYRGLRPLVSTMSTPLVSAIQQKLYKAAELLCADGRTEVNKREQKDYNALMVACRSGDVNMVHLLLRHPRIDVDVKDAKGNTALHLVARHRDARCLNALIDYFENHSPERKVERMNVENNSGDTPLDIALRAGNLAIQIDLYKHWGRRGLPRQLRDELSKRKAWSGLVDRIREGFSGTISDLIGGYAGTHVSETPTLRF